MDNMELKYVGFWSRTGAMLIDALILLIITGPILTVYYGESYWASEKIIAGPLDFILTYLFPIVATIGFWIAKQATPGKMAIQAKIVDANTGKAPSTGQYIGRYFAYIISLLPLGLGLIWIAFDPRKQGWHDKLSGTVVIAPKVAILQDVKFNDS